MLKPNHGAILGISLLCLICAGATATYSRDNTNSRSQAAPGNPMLDSVVEVKPALRPISRLLETVQQATGVVLSRAASVPDDCVFAANCTEITGTLLKQLRLLLSDDEWQYQWANRVVGKENRTYRLWRTRVDEKQRHAYQEQQLRARLAQLLQLLQAGPEAWGQVAKSDPDLANYLRQPICQARLSLLGRLSPAQLSSILAGRPLILPVSQLGPDDQNLVQTAASDAHGSVTDANGNTRILFDSRNLMSTGGVRIGAKPSGNEPGALSLVVNIFTEGANNSETGSSMDVLYPAIAEEFADQRKQFQTEKKRQDADALANVTPGAHVVTIDANLKTEKEEPPLAAYLRSFADQTKLTLLAYWPKEAKEPKTRLPKSIVKKPVAEALDILCASYNCEWVRDGQVIRLRSKPHDKRDLAIGGKTR